MKYHPGSRMKSSSAEGEEDTLTRLQHFLWGSFTGEVGRMSPAGEDGGGRIRGGWSVCVCVYQAVWVAQHHRLHWESRQEST